jgi:putative transposase
MYKYTGKGTNYNQQANQLPEIKEIRPEYQGIHSQVLQDVLRRVDKTYKDFFKRIQQGKKGFPRYQGRNRYDSFTYPQVGFSLEQGKLVLSKIGHLKIKLHREIEGKIKTCTIKREGQHWYVCFSCEVEACPQTPYTDDVIGIDLGLLHFATLSTGDTIENPRYGQKSMNKLAKAQRALARKKRGSNRRKKAVQRVARCHRKVRNQRKDFLHKQARQLVQTYETIVFEDLAPSKMSRAPKSKQDEETGQYLPNGASAKAGLNQSILDAGWSTFVSLCESKAAYAGYTQIIKVDPYKTSQVCSSCGVEGPHKDLSERTHTCTSCGVVLDRDHNAAINIKNIWLGRSLRKTKRVRSVA